MKHIITMQIAGLGIFLVLSYLGLNIFLAGAIALVTLVTTALIWNRFLFGEWWP